MWAIVLMESPKMQSIKCQNGTLIGNRKRQHRRVADSLIGLSGIACG